MRRMQTIMVPTCENKNGDTKWVACKRWISVSSDLGCRYKMT